MSCLDIGSESALAAKLKIRNISDANDESDSGVDTDDLIESDDCDPTSFSHIPVEIVEYILSLVPDPISQRRFSQVCRLWRDAVFRLRWLKLLSFERRIHLRLPLAGSLHEIHGNKGFSLLLTVTSPVLLAGVAIFLPYRDNFEFDVRGQVDLLQHGTPHIGPHGEILSRINFNISRDTGRSWQEDCRGENPLCLQGPWQNTRPGGTLAGGCIGLHPFPLIFPALVELQTGVRYLLRLYMLAVNNDQIVSDTVGTVWGFQGVPRRKPDPEQNHFRWFQVYRQGLSSSVSSGQFPIIYYIS